MVRTLRWNLLALVVVVALVAALWPRGTRLPPAQATAPTSTGASVPVSAEADLTGPRAAADLQPCPTTAPGATRTTGPLAGVVLECLGDGSRVDLGTALAGKPALLNVWTYWCPPCAAELPAVQEFAEQAGDQLTVLTVHSEVKPVNALLKLADYGVHVPTVQDSAGEVAALVGAAQVVPTTVLLDADGTVAKILAVPYTDAGAITADVQRYLGVGG